MDRRRFLRNAALLAGGVVAADQLELLDRLGWTRKYFSGADFSVNRTDLGYYRIVTLRHEGGSATMSLQGMRNLSDRWMDLEVKLVHTAELQVGAVVAFNTQIDGRRITASVRDCT